MVYWPNILLLLLLCIFSDPSMVCIFWGSIEREEYKVMCVCVCVCMCCERHEGKVTKDSILWRKKCARLGHRIWWKILKMIITGHTAAFSLSRSSTAGIGVICVSNIAVEQATTPRWFLYSLKSAVGSPYWLVEVQWWIRQHWDQNRT